MGIGYWVVRTYEAGDVGEKTKFWIPEQRPPKGARRLKSDIKKQEQNEASAIKNLARLLNANFTAGDVLLGLDYSAEGMKRLEARARKSGAYIQNSEEWADAVRNAAEHELRLVLRRVKYKLENVKYIAVTSDMDGDTGEVVRVHHHLVVPAGTEKVFKGAWAELGHADWSYMRRQDDYMPVAEYLLKQVRKTPDAKKYMSSRNLIRPVPRDRIVNSGAELRVPQGARLLHRNEYKPGLPQYIRYILPAAEERRQRERENESRRQSGKRQRVAASGG